LNITGPGAVVVDASTNVFALAVNSGANTGASGSINLNAGGSLTTARDIQAGTGSSYLNFYGGTLKAGTNSSTFLQGLSQVSISSDGATIDDGGYTITVAQAIQDNGGGFLNKTGSGTLYLDGANAYYGATKVAAGALGGAGSVLGDLIVSNGAALAPGDAGAPGTFTVGGNFSLAGNLLVDVNTSLAQSNDFVSVTGSLDNAGTGAVIVTNLGPTLAVGEKFTLFSSALPNGNALTVTGGGATWANNLATDGSISVLSVVPTVNTNTFALQSSVSGSTLNLSWPSDRLGWVVQVQTNALNTGLSQNWVTLPATASVTNYSLTINPGNPAVFIRMMYQP
jgi:autotransporter-associated beta strand protein